MKHPEHICGFNDAPQSCECYDSGYDAAMKAVKERVAVLLSAFDGIPEDQLSDADRGYKSALKDLEAPVEGDNK
jgi:hypothetical protein